MTVLLLLKSKNNESVNSCKLEVDPDVYLRKSLFIQVKRLCRLP